MFNLNDLLNKASDLLEESAERDIKNANQKFALMDLLEDAEIRENGAQILTSAALFGTTLLNRLADILDGDEEAEETPEEDEAPAPYSMSFDLTGDGADELFKVFFVPTASAAPEPDPEPEVPEEDDALTAIYEAFGLSDEAIANIRSIVEKLEAQADDGDNKPSFRDFPF